MYAKYVLYCKKNTYIHTYVVGVYNGRWYWPIAQNWRDYESIYMYKDILKKTFAKLYARYALRCRRNRFSTWSASETYLEKRTNSHIFDLRLACTKPRPKPHRKSMWYIEKRILNAYKSPSSSVVELHACVIEQWN